MFQILFFIFDSVSTQVLEVRALSPRFNLILVTNDSERISPLAKNIVLIRVCEYSTLVLIVKVEVA